MQTTVIKDLGLIDYHEAYSYQMKCVQQVLSGGSQAVILCEHPAVITLGRLSNKENLLAGPEILKKNSVSVHQMDRGGDITLHAPGQLVVYPILNLANYKKDLHWYLRKLEELSIDLLKDFGIVANRFSPHTGVWVGNRKIISIGIGVRRWVSYHGLAINVATNLDIYSMIRPCGLSVEMTSMSQLKGYPLNITEVKKAVGRYWDAHFSINTDKNRTSQALSLV